MYKYNKLDVDIKNIITDSLRFTADQNIAEGYSNVKK
jgi:hypothetical protein